jgi:hypothetical protein
MTYALHLQFHQIPASMNKKLRSHWRKNHRENLVWDILVASSCRLSKPKAPLEKARIRVLRHHHRFLDFDNAVASCKPVIDALVTAGVILDDSWPVVGAWDVGQVFRPKKEGPMLEVWVYELTQDVGTKRVLLQTQLK